MASTKVLDFRLSRALAIALAVLWSLSDMIWKTLRWQLMLH